MTIDHNSNSSESPTQKTVPQIHLPPTDGASDNDLSPESQTIQQVFAAINSFQTQQNIAAITQQRLVQKPMRGSPRATIITLVAIAIIFIGLSLNNFFISLIGTLLALILSIAVLWPWLQNVVAEYLPPQERSILVAFLGVAAALVGLFKITGTNRRLLDLGSYINWDAFGTLAEWFGALGQILIAIIAVYVAWRQYIISKDLTIQQNLLTVQQNLITQQQTVDSYFQGISELVLDDQGLLEDWPQERAIAQGRTAAILSSVDGSGKAKILRFLSSSNLLTPLKRDLRLGRAILDGGGGYAEDRIQGIRVVELGVMLAGADISGTDLRWVDLSDANLVRANLTRCDLIKANLSRTILYEGQLAGADLKGTRFFYGKAEDASPRSRTDPPNYETGEQTGAVVENVDLTDVQRMSESVRYYCCAWGGEKTRATIPGGCEGIPNKLGR